MRVERVRSGTQRSASPPLTCKLMASMAYKCERCAAYVCGSWSEPNHPKADFLHNIGYPNDPAAWERKHADAWWRRPPGINRHPPPQREIGAQTGSRDPVCRCAGRARSFISAPEEF
jgi:hypothetical protein